MRAFKRETLIRYLAEDRQWRRSLRLQYARRMLKISQHPDYSDRSTRPPQFWQAVIEANERS